MTGWPEAALRAYVLGLLGEEEAEALEIAYFGDPDLLARVRAAEDDLLDDAASGRLEAGEQQALDGRLAAVPRLRARLEAARALRLVSRERGRTVAVRRVLVPLALAAALLLAVIGFFGWGGKKGLDASPTPEARLGLPSPTPVPPSASAVPVPSPRASDVARPPVGRLAFALAPTLLRGTGRTPELRLPPGTAEVVLQLGGDLGGAPGLVAASVETVEGAAIWRGAARRSTAPATAATVAVPAERLAPGDYLLTLTVGGEPRHRYFFRVLPS